jgi:hypothetical protein
MYRIRSYLEIRMCVYDIRIYFTYSLLTQAFSLNSQERNNLELSFL